MASILDEYQLTREKFEGCICNGITKPQILTIFQMTDREMTDWCLKEYGKTFETTYRILREIAIMEFTDVVKSFSMRGNQTAMNLYREMVSGTKQSDTVKLEFVNNIKVENEDDRESL